MNLIVAVDQNWSIGQGDRLLFWIPEDLKYFKAKTLDQVVVMGHTTLRTLPGSRPLKGRVNLVLSRRADLSIEGAIVCHGLSELGRELARYPEQEIWVMGGETIYQQLLPYCQKAYVTKVEASVPADKRFEDLDRHPDWHLVNESPAMSYEELTYRFLCYEQDQPLVLPMQEEV